MSFTKTQLRKFADLIRIDIPDDKLDSMNIDSIIEWIDKLKSVDTIGVEPMITPAEHAAPMRDDVVTDGDMRDAVLRNAPDKTGVSRGYFAVPKVMDE